jgi:hypothetical protein
MVTRDFDAMLAERAGIRPTFRVGGQEFTLRKKLAYAKWNKLLAAMRSPEADTDANQATIDFFNVVLIPADRERFAALVLKADDDDDDDDVIDLTQMDELTDWILEVFTGKPQSNSNSSKAGSNGTGVAPNVVSLSSKQPANAN